MLRIKIILIIWKAIVVQQELGGGVTAMMIAPLASWCWWAPPRRRTCCHQNELPPKISPKPPQNVWEELICLKLLATCLNELCMRPGMGKQHWDLKCVYNPIFFFIVCNDWGPSILVERSGFNGLLQSSARPYLSHSVARSNCPQCFLSQLLIVMVVVVVSSKGLKKVRDDIDWTEWF